MVNNSVYVKNNYITAPELNDIEVSEAISTKLEGGSTVGEADLGKEQVPYPSLKFYYSTFDPFPSDLPFLLISLSF